MKPFILLSFIFTSTLFSEPWPRHVIDNTLCGADGVKLYDINHDGFLDIVTGWEESGETRLYLNPGKKSITQPWQKISIGKTPDAEDAVIIPAEQPTILSCCEGRTKALMLHWSRNNNDSLPFEKWQQLIIPASKNKMQWMYAEPIIIKSRQAIVAAGKNEKAEIGWWEFTTILDVNSWKWHKLQNVGWIMSIIPFDVDADGDMDIIYSDRKGENRGCWWLEQTDNPNIWPRHSIGAHEHEVMFICSAHLDRNKQIDVLVCAKPRKILAFTQKTKSNYSLEFPEHTGTAKSVEWADINNDNRADIVFSCEHADSGKAGLVWLEQKKCIFKTKWREHDISGPEGIKFDRIRLQDIDLDGDVDVLTCEERFEDCGLGVIWYENTVH